MLLAALPALAACSALRPSFRQPSAPTRRHAMIFASEGDKLETERAAVEALRARVAELEQSVAQQREAVASEAETSRRQSAEVAAEAEAEAHSESDAHPAPAVAAPAPATPASERGLDLSVSEGVLAELRAPFEANASQFSESTWSEAVASVEAALAAGWEAQAEERAELRAAIEARRSDPAGGAG